MPTSFACDLQNIGGSATSCTESFSGISTYVLVAKASDLTAAPEYDNTKAEFTESSFTFAEGKGFYRFNIKRESGRMTGTSNGKKKGFSNVITFLVEEDFDKMSYVSRTLNNAECIVMTPDGMGKYYVVYDPTVPPTVEINFDSGAAYADDSGYTLTVTAPRTLYATTKWSGTPTMAGTASSD